MRGIRVLENGKLSINTNEIYGRNNDKILEAIRKCPENVQEFICDTFCYGNERIKQTLSYLSGGSLKKLVFFNTYAYADSSDTEMYADSSDDLSPESFLFNDDVYFTNLEHLAISDISDKCASKIIDFTDLTNLVFLHIPNFNRSENLTINKIIAKVHEMSQNGYMSQLCDLEVHCDESNYMHIKNLLKIFPDLKFLTIHSYHTDTMHNLSEELGKIPLHGLEIDGGIVNIEGGHVLINKLLKNKNLWSLCLNNIRINFEMIKYNRMKNIVNIEVVGNNIDMKIVSLILKSCMNLESIALDRNILDENDVIKILETIENMPNLYNISLRYLNISREIFPSIINKLKNNKHLVRICFEQHYILSDPNIYASHIEEMLEENIALREIPNLETTDRIKYLLSDEGLAYRIKNSRN